MGRGAWWTRAWIEDAIERYQRVERLLADFDRALAKVDVTVHSPDGLVEVVVAADGTIREVTISDSAQGRRRVSSPGRCRPPSPPPPTRPGGPAPSCTSDMFARLPRPAARPWPHGAG